MDLRGAEFDFRVFVAHELAELALGFVTRFAERGAVGIADELFPAIFVVQGERADFAGGGVEFDGDVFPGEALGAHFGGAEQGIVEEREFGGEVGSIRDHGGPRDEEVFVRMDTIRRGRAFVKPYST